ncbi:otoancorin-like [Cochliomyia hominivorax]
MNIFFFACNIFWLYSISATKYCHEILADRHVKKVNWSYLKQCLTTVNGQEISKDIGENIWRLVKLSFETLDNIPPESFSYIGYSLTFIPLQDLNNISMENVDVVEAFGAIRSSDNKGYQNGFNVDQLNLLAQKVRQEWLGKNPQTYSEYDLKAMGEILCYMNVTDIEKIHADAFKEAAEWIGMIEKCPQNRLQALANLAKRPEAFGMPQKWSKLEVSIIGNILNGLTTSEIKAISKDKLQLNRFYKVINPNQIDDVNEFHNNRITKLNRFRY